MTRQPPPAPRILLDPETPSASEPVRIDLETACLMASSSPAPGASGPEPAASNQDCAAAILCPAGQVLLVVADGVGGSRQGRLAARIATGRIVAAAMRTGPGDRCVRSAILDAIDEADDAIRRLGTGAATTIAVAEIVDDTLRTYHVGDTTVLACSARGRLRIMTVAHNPTERAVEAGWMDHGEALEHDQRHVVSNVLGSGRPRIEIGPRIRLAARDTVLIASDGLFDNLVPDEITGIIRRAPVEQSFRRLIEQAQARMAGWPESGKPDDLTAIVWRRQSRRAATGYLAA